GAKLVQEISRVCAAEEDFGVRFEEDLVPLSWSGTIVRLRAATFGAATGSCLRLLREKPRQGPHNLGARGFQRDGTLSLHQLADQILGLEGEINHLRRDRKPSHPCFIEKLLDVMGEGGHLFEAGGGAGAFDCMNGP